MTVLGGLIAAVMVICGAAFVTFTGMFGYQAFESMNLPGWAGAAWFLVMTSMVVLAAFRERKR